MKPVSQLLAPFVQPLLTKIGWDNMDERERLMVVGLVAVVVALLFFSFVFSPLLESRQRLQKSIVKKNAQLQEMHIMQKEYLDLQQQSGNIQSRIEKRAKGFTLFSYIEKQAATAKVKQNIKYLKPSKVEREGELQESRVDMKLQRISTGNLVTFLTGLESKEQVI